MNRNTPPAHAADVAPEPSDALGLLLQQHFADDAEPPDDGFAERVLAALPAHAPPSPVPRRRLAQARWALWTALSVAACLAAALLSATQGRLDGEEGLAALAMLALIAFWSWPARWLHA